MVQRTPARTHAHPLTGEHAQGMVEYGLIIALVAVVAIAGLIILGPQLSTLFNSLGSSI